MTATHGLGTYGDAAGTVTPLDHKMAQLGLVTKTAANTIRSGLFWDGSATVVSGKSNMSYDVRAFTGVSSRGASAGAVFLANDGVYNVVTGAAPGSNSRIDVVYVWQREFSLDGTDSNPVIGVEQGVAGAVPVEPSLAAYPGAIKLATIVVPAGVTATNSGTTITQTAPFTASAGGVVPVRSTTERDAGTWLESQIVWLIDSDTLQQYSGSAWRAVSVAASVPITPTSVAGSGVTLSGSKVVISGASAASINGCFTSDYDWYLVKYKVTSSGAANVNMTLRVGGTDSTTAYYRVFSRGLSAANTVATATNQANWPTSLTTVTGLHFGDMNLQDVAVATGTTATLVSGTTAATMTTSDGATYTATLQHTVATAYDGFTLTPSTGTITGTVRIYGFN